MKKLIIMLFALLVLCSCAATNVPEEEELTEEYYDRKFMDEVVTDEEKRENIFSALDDIKINTELIKDFKKVEETAEGEKYSFIYRETEFTVIMAPDSTISSVKVGEDGADVYLKGYEPYDVENYIMPKSRIQGFQHMMINAVESSFDDPEIYEFSADWTYSHEEPFYYTKGTVLVGEEKEEHYMELIYYYEVEENTMHWYSLVVDGDPVILETMFDEPVIPERQKLS